MTVQNRAVTMDSRASTGALVAILSALAYAGCGGATGASGTTALSPTPSGSGGASAPTITIVNNSVTPKNITVSPGSRVIFVNNDAQPHDMESDPHPIHTDCPEINQVGFLSPGQNRQTGTLSVARTCGYHDHNRDTIESLQGTITIR